MENWARGHILLVSLVWLGSGFLTGISASIFYVAINWKNHLRYRNRRIKEWLFMAAGITAILTPFGLTVVGLVPFYVLSLIIGKWAEDDGGGGGGYPYSPDSPPQPSDKFDPKEIVEEVLRKIQGRLVSKLP